MRVKKAEAVVPAKAGPITTGLCCPGKASTSVPDNRRRGVWVPDRARFARLSGTTSKSQPDGQIKKSCPAPRAKIFRLTRRANQGHDSARLTRQEGRLAIVTKRAVGCGGRGCAFDERRGCGRRSRVVLTPRRWRQVYGAIRRRRWQESPFTGEGTL